MTAAATTLVSEIDQLLRQRQEGEADIVAKRALQAAAAQARAEEREACAQLVEVSPDGIRCPFDDPNCKVEFEGLCPVCGQDNNGEGGKQCVGSTYRVSTAAAIRARSTD